MRIDEIITVLQACKQGKTIQVRSGARLLWEDDEMPIWDFYHCDYRVKPEPPKPREWLIPIGTRVTVNANGTTSHDTGALGEYVKVREVIE